jgi:hypothetical protein
MNDTIDVKELMIKDSEVFNHYIDKSTEKTDDSDDHLPVEHAGRLEDESGTEFIVFMDQLGYTEIRAADDPRFGCDWRQYEGDGE